MIRQPLRTRGVTIAGLLLGAAFSLALITPASASASTAEFASASSVASVDAAPAATATRPQLLLILDASGSMKRVGTDGRTSMEAAKASLRSVVDTLPENWDVGLRVFGSTVNGHGKPTRAACRDTQLVVPMAPVEPVTLDDAIAATRPLGETPIAYTLATAVAHDFTGGGSRSILLVSDGEESCSPDPCVTVRDLQDNGISVKIDTVGLGVGSLARRQLTCIAEHNSGHYYDSPGTSDLAAAFRQAMAALGSLGNAVGSVNTSNVSGSGASTSPEGGSGGVGASGVAIAIIVLLVWVLGSKK